MKFEIRLDSKSLWIRISGTKSLKYGLKRFNEECVECFQSSLGTEKDIGKLEKVKEIIEKVFDFVPSYKELN